MLPTPSTFEIVKRSPHPMKSLLLPAAAAATRGVAYMEDTATPGSAKLADGTVPIAGFVTRPVLIGGPTIADAVMPNRLELPFAAADYGSFEQGEEVEVAEGFGEYQAGAVAQGAEQPGPFEVRLGAGVHREDHRQSLRHSAQDASQPR